jgi:predicted RNase H-like HicB family nuclease
MKKEKVIWNFRIPVNISKKKNYYWAYCKIFDVGSQGKTLEEAKKNVVDAMVLFFTTCWEMGSFHQVMEEAGFHPIKTTEQKRTTKLKNDNYIDVPIPFFASNKQKLGCHA